MDNIDADYPLPNFPPARIRYRLLLANGTYIYQLTPDYIEKYIWKITNFCINLSRSPTYSRDINFATFVIHGVFISFQVDVIDFIKVHNIETVLPMLTHAINISLKRNSKHVEMSDLQPYLALKHKVWTLGSNTDYFVAKRSPIKRVTSHKFLISKLKGTLRTNAREVLQRNN